MSDYKINLTGVETLWLSTILYEVTQGKSPGFAQSILDKVCTELERNKNDTTRKLEDNDDVMNNLISLETKLNLFITELKKDTNPSQNKSGAIVGIEKSREILLEHIVEYIRSK